MDSGLRENLYQLFFSDSILGFWPCSIAAVAFSSFVIIRYHSDVLMRILGSRKATPISTSALTTAKIMPNTKVTATIP